MKTQDIYLVIKSTFDGGMGCDEEVLEPAYVDIIEAEERVLDETDKNEDKHVDFFTRKIPLSFA